MLAVEEMLFKAFLATPGTWHVEIDGGDAEHIFDLKISAGQNLLGCNIYLHNLLDAAGRLTGTYGVTVTAEVDRAVFL